MLRPNRVAHTARYLSLPSLLFLLPIISACLHVASVLAAPTSKDSNNIQIKLRAVKFSAYSPFDGELYTISTSQAVRDYVVTQLVAQQVPGVCDQDVLLYLQIETGNANVESQPLGITLSLRSTKSSTSVSRTGMITFKDMQFCEFENTGYYPATSDTPVQNSAVYGPHPYGANITDLTYTTQLWNEAYQFVSIAMNNLHQGLTYKVKCVTTLACNPLGTDGQGNVQAAIDTGAGMQTVPYRDQQIDHTFGVRQPLLRLIKWYDNSTDGCTQMPPDDPGSEYIYYLRYPYERVLCYRVENLGNTLLYQVAINDILCDGKRPFVYPGIGVNITIAVNSSITIPIDSTDPEYAHLFANPVSFDDYPCEYTARATSYFTAENGRPRQLQSWLEYNFANPSRDSIFDAMSSMSEEAILGLQYSTAHS